MDPDEQRQNIIVQVTKTFQDVKVSLPKLKKLVRAVCNRFSLSAATVSIAIVSDSEIQKLNRKFLNCDSVTDCLSFDLTDENVPDDKPAQKSFELVVSAETAVRQAKQRGHSSEAELALYVTHCLLHQLGFGDLTHEKAEKMHKTEREILQQQGFNLEYN